MRDRRPVAPQSARRSASAPVRPSMPRDPDVEQLPGPRLPRHVGGQSHIVPQWRAVDIPCQHPNLVLHFVCELREPRPNSSPVCGRGLGRGALAQRSAGEEKRTARQSTCSLPSFPRRREPRCRRRSSNRRRSQLVRGEPVGPPLPHHMANALVPRCSRALPYFA